MRRHLTDLRARDCLLKMECKFLLLVILFVAGTAHARGVRLLLDICSLLQVKRSFAYS